MKRFLPHFGLVLVAAAIVGLAGGQTVSIIDYVGLYALVALGLVLLTGVAGLTSFGQAAFVGIAAYATALMSTAYDASPATTLVVSLAITGVAALVLGAITLKLSGHYLPLSTIAWGISLFFLFGNLEILGGHTGIDRIPPMTVAGHPLTDGRVFLILIWACVLLASWAMANLLASRRGRALHALKASAVMAETFGIDAYRERLTIFVIAAILAGLSGWLYAYMLRFVNPSPFGLSASIEYLFMAVVGGAGQVGGAVVGSLVITLAREWLQDWLPRLVGTSGNFEMIAFGALVILLLHRSDQGLAPRLAFVGRWFSRGRGPRATAVGARDLPRRALPPAGETILSVEGAVKRFRGLTAVSSVAFTVNAGEILGLIGPNGAGKSTLFNLISGTLPLSEGTIRFRGEVISGLAPRRIGAAGIARTFQHVEMIPGLSVLDNVMVGAHRRVATSVVASCLHLERGLEASLRAEAERQIARVGLEEDMHLPAGSLPLGKQRVLEIARALAADPILLILDEPAAGLRLPERRKLHRLLRQLRTEGVTILLVEHDLDFVMSLVDRLVVMSFGQKICEGTPATVQRDPRVIEAYLGDAA